MAVNYQKGMQPLMDKIKAIKPKSLPQKGVALYFDKVSPYYGQYTGADFPVGIPFTAPDLYDEAFFDRSDADELLADWQKVTSDITAIFRAFCIEQADTMSLSERITLIEAWAKISQYKPFITDDYLAVMDKLFKLFQAELQTDSLVSKFVSLLQVYSPVLCETDYGLFYNSSLIKSDY